jgi:hypothetical protein
VAVQPDHTQQQQQQQQQQQHQHQHQHQQQQQRTVYSSNGHRTLTIAVAAPVSVCVEDSLEDRWLIAQCKYLKYEVITTVRTTNV